RCAAGRNHSPITSASSIITSPATSTAAAPDENLTCLPAAFAGGGVPNEAPTRALPNCWPACRLLLVVVTLDPPPLVWLPCKLTAQPGSSPNAAMIGRLFSNRFMRQV